MYMAVAASYSFSLTKCLLENEGAKKNNCGKTQLEENSTISKHCKGE
jgi:hypothetical protein